MSSNLTFLSSLIIRGKVVNKTGLLVGGLSEEIRIAKVDAIVIRDPTTSRPYIPGSTLKGKMRSALEYFHDKIRDDGKVHMCEDPDCPICRPFGASLGKETGRKIGPTRVIIRDCLMDDETVSELERLGYTEYTELKGENVINRLTSQATPRFFERVPPNSKFDLEINYLILSTNGDNGKKDVEMLKQVFLSLHLLEDMGIGRAVSRGYGKVEFRISELKLHKKEFYEGTGEEVNLFKEIFEKEAVRPGEILKKFEEIKEKILENLRD